MKQIVNEKDKIILRESGLSLADLAIDSVNILYPGIKIAWVLCKALFGSALKLREKRVLEWAEMIKNNSSVFINIDKHDENFQDGFIFALEKFIIERNENKRKTMKKIFLEFSVCQNKINFPLEKLFYVLNQLSERDTYVLRDVDPDRQDNNYQIYSDERDIDSIYSLIQCGILFQDHTARFIGEVGKNSPFVKMTNFGKEFIKYLME